MALNILPGDHVDPTEITPLIKSFGKIGAFGDLVFCCSREKVFTFDDYNRESKARYAKHDLLNQTPAIEYLGRDVEEISFKMIFARSLGVNPEKSAKILREKCENGEAEYLVIGGEVIGKNQWVIESFSETAKQFDGWGKILVSEVSVKMKEYRWRLWSTT